MTPLPQLEPAPPLPIRVLLVEDSPRDAFLFTELLTATPGRFTVVPAASLQAGLKALDAGGIDLVMTDLSLSDSDCETTFTELRQRAPHLPMIVLSGLECEEMAMRMVERGAQDYLRKGSVDEASLVRSVRYAMERHRFHTELQRAHDTLEVRVAERTAQLETALADLQAAQDRLVQQERLSALGRMASGIAHDFNNAISPIVGFSELLLNPSPLVQSKSKDYLRLIHTAAKDSADIVRRLREFYRYRDEHDVFGPVDLNDLVRQVAALTRPRWKDQALGRGAHIELALDLGCVPVICGSESELREMLINLVFNAVDAIEGNGTITCRTFTRGASAVLEVSDTGGGMSEEVCARCLEPFFSTKAAGGTGLGLAMVHGIVRRHDGELKIDSMPGSGATVAITLLPHNDTCPGGTAPPAAARPDVPLRILVVDDEPPIREVLSVLLEEDGHTVELAANGREGLEKFRAGQFDLVMTDRAMPQLNGDQLAAALREIAPGLPILLVTGFADLMQDVGDHPSAIDVVVRKPFSRDSLRAAIVQGLAAHRQPSAPAGGAPDGCQAASAR